VVNAIAPLAETLFPTSRIPVPKTWKGERWIIFEERSPASIKSAPISASPEESEAIREQKKKNRRTTLTSYHSTHPQTPLRSPQSQPRTPLHLPPVPPTPKSAGLRKLRLAPSRPTSPLPPPLPSAPLRKTSSDELMVNITLDPQPPKSAAAVSGKKPFLRPFLLGGRKEVIPKPPDLPFPGRPAELRPILPELNHVQRPLEDFKPMTYPDSKTHAAGYRSVDTHHNGTRVAAIGDDYLHVQLPESPYEETAFISEDDPPLPQLSRPSTAKQGVVTLQIDPAASMTVEVKPQDGPEEAMTPVLPRVAQLRGSTSLNSPISPSPLSSSLERTGLESSTPTPTSRVAEVAQSPSLSPTTPTPTPATPLTSVAPLTPIIPPSPMTSAPRKERRERTERHERSERSAKESSKSRSTNKSSRTKAESRSHRHEREPTRVRTRSKPVPEEESWLEVLLQDLPFGPDEKMVSISVLAVLGERSILTTSSKRLNRSRKTGESSSLSSWG
jgi:hypothetical protein